MSTKQNFVDLMDRLKIPQRDRKRSGERIEFTDKRSLYHGTDQSGRVFVNVPIYATERNKETTTDAIVVYQLYKNKVDRLAINTNTFIITTFGFVGDRLDDLSILVKLLSGEKIRFYNRQYTGTFYVEDLTHWVEISLIPQQPGITQD